MSRRVGLAVGLALTLFASVPSEGEESSDERASWQTLFARGYYPGRSGQVFYVLEPGEILLRRPMGYYRFMHGGPWPYDRDLPLLFYGPGFVEPGALDELASQEDVAPTLLSAVGLPRAATMTGRALPVLRRGSEPPRATVLVVLDGMRRDYLERYRDSLPVISRMRREGAELTEARISYLPTVTSAGHASLATGAEPRVHGISGNGYFDRASGETKTLFEGVSPGNLMALGLADLWAQGFGPAAEIVVQGTTPRATVSLAGLGACTPNGYAPVVALFDYRSAGYVTNPDCYRLPDYLSRFDARAVWESSTRTYRDLEVDDGRAFVITDRFPGFQTDALLEMLEREGVGRDDVPDLVLVNYKTPDYVGHYYGPDSAEMREALSALDSEIGRILEALEASAGKGGWMVALASDHGMPGEPNPADGRSRRFVRELIVSLHEKLDPEGLLIYEYLDTANLQLYVNRERLFSLSLSLDDVARELEALPYVRAAFTEDVIRASAATERRHDP